MTIVYLLTFVGVLVFITLVCAMALVPTALDLGAAGPAIPPGRAELTGNWSLRTPTGDDSAVPPSVSLQTIDQTSLVAHPPT